MISSGHFVEQLFLNATDLPECPAGWAIGYGAGVVSAAAFRASVRTNMIDASSSPVFVGAGRALSSACLPADSFAQNGPETTPTRTSSPGTDTHHEGHHTHAVAQSHTLSTRPRTHTDTRGMTRMLSTDGMQYKIKRGVAAEGGSASSRTTDDPGPGPGSQCYVSMLSLPRARARARAGVGLGSLLCLLVADRAR